MLASTPNFNSLISFGHMEAVPK